MFSNALTEQRRSLAVRLTLWYAGIFALTSSIAFTAAYFLVLSVIQARTDADMIEDIREFAALLNEGGIDRVATEMRIETAGEGAEDAFFRLWDSGGEPLLSTDLEAWHGLETPPPAFVSEPQLQTLDLPDREHDVRVVFGTIGDGLGLQIGESIEADEELADALLNGFLLILVSVVVLGAPIGWFMARRALRGVRDVTRTATEIATGDLDRRVPVGSRGDELDRLAAAFNGMLDRIQALIVGMREMTDNLAHDFRSPLARIRASAEMSLADGASEDFESMAANTAEECDRLLEMINTTLDIAEAESGAARLRLSDVKLVQLVRDAVDLFQPVAEDKEVSIDCHLSGACRVRGDLQRLQRVVTNLIDNAIKYTPSGGHVSITLTEHDNEVLLAVEDDGMGMSAEECERIFERFYRCDRSRSQSGNGLGLSLALAFVRAHQGSLTASSRLGEGSRFQVTLPRCDTASRSETC